MRCVLLVLAHGSRRHGSNEEVRRLSGRLGELLGERYARVAPAFLELAEPPIPAAIDAAVSAGADEVVLFPYFLAAGRHVCDDIPRLVAEARRRHPRVRLELRPHLGELPGLLPLLAEYLR
ncbi:CbiX/SirB N-terminal domain-containing protein [Nitrococcus mobilis]|uniref:CbiX/SirB N-terminal domain-containing protein n=1 Tax=Nitrococcus mobilis TaxID=35797 RepID=UPI000320D5FD|nr:CbiX/SirB N-terminal domain-containing protein [Nitrococcus mobilis]